jgi:DNA-directed RNA polymerase subunit N (RpoN/RPB10)
MEYYKEYTIRCPTCGGQIAHLSETYEFLIVNNSIEDALKLLGLDNPCCRICMMTPTIVVHNMENRELIEGFKKTDSLDETTAKKESTGLPVFSMCLGQAKRNLNMEQVSDFSEKISHPIIPDISMGRTPIVLQNVPLEQPNTEFQNPVLVGFPTINSDNTKQLDKVYVGAKKYSQVLKGRTYLAR